MSQTGIERAVQAYFDGVNGERYADVGALFAPDGELRAPGVDVRRGPDEISSYFAAALRNYPEHFDDPVRIVVAGPTVLVEIHYTGRLASGAKIEFDAVDVFDFDDQDRIARLSSWYDSHLVRKRLRAAREAAEA
jgi:ketosteroid isomerase-like protein